MSRSAITRLAGEAMNDFCAIVGIEKTDNVSFDSRDLARLAPFSPIIAKMMDIRYKEEHDVD